jgi:arylsulfatase A-like enzyme
MFTGLLPHEHGATSQTRDIDQGRPCLAELMKQQGYVTRQLTNNVATTHIFGLDRGFDDVERYYQSIVVKGNPLYNFLVICGKPRMRRRFLKGDWLMNRMAEDMEASRSWVVSGCEGQLNRAREILSEHRKKGEKLFLFINLMDTHFPYQVAPRFELSAPGMWQRLKELYGLYHLVNQTHLLREKSPLSLDSLLRLRGRQYKAWDRIGPMVDAFVSEVHGDAEQDNTVLFCSDHGDNFGENNWQYHFSNVTDAGNKVPLFWLRGGESSPGTIDTPISMRDLYPSLCQEVGVTSEEAGMPLFHLIDEPERSSSVTEAFWYNNRGRTRPEYRCNQFSFIADSRRYVHRSGQWSACAVQSDLLEPVLEPMGSLDAMQEAVLDREQRISLQLAFEHYSSFSRSIEAAAAP